MEIFAINKVPQGTPEILIKDLSNRDWTDLRQSEPVRKKN